MLCLVGIKMLKGHTWCSLPLLSQNRGNEPKEISLLAGNSCWEREKLEPSGHPEEETAFSLDEDLHLDRWSYRRDRGMETM